MLFPNAVALVIEGMWFAERRKCSLRIEMMLHRWLKQVVKKIPAEPLGVWTCRLTVDLTLCVSPLSFVSCRQ